MLPTDLSDPPSTMRTFLRRNAARITGTPTLSPDIAKLCKSNQEGADIERRLKLLQDLADAVPEEDIPDPTSSADEDQ